ncbi:KH domain-containing protein [Microcystis aeruginosa]|uniref:Uncharacterized protein n=1 Tax=Microcystis aeruginosa PCC 9808 TaxID=1160284 RepID=I4HFV4_MICAE|nr:hypothetical protein [Microcystis aeruginosa]CCI20928.1 hypothetical protein MICAG_1160011 [Microcystis aeruginosa PCC 9808]
MVPLALPVALVLDGISLLTSGANEKEIAEQRKVAIDIIRAGKENGVDEIEITMSQKAGVGLSSDVDGVPIEFIVGASGTMKLKVKWFFVTWYGSIWGHKSTKSLSGKRFN